MDSMKWKRRAAKLLDADAWKRHITMLPWKAQASLFNMLSPYQSQNFQPQLDIERPVIHLGRESAAYAVYPESLGPNPIVYSLGVGSDISFDIDAIDRLNATVYAFDPTDQSARYLSTLKLPERFNFEQVGVGGKNSAATLSTLKPSGAHYLAGTVLNVKNRHGGPKRIVLKSIGQIMADLGHTSIDIVKMDIEGGEIAVIEELINENLDIHQLTLEVHPHLYNLENHGTLLGRHGWAQADKILQDLRRVGYRLFNISERGTELSLLRDR